MANLLFISITPTGVLIPQGDSQQFTATGYYNNSTSQDLTGSVAWTSSDATVASVDANGLATGVGPGQVAIGAQSGAIQTTVNASVEAGLAGLGILPASISLQPGQTQQFAAVGTFSDSHTEGLTNQVMWSSSAPGAVAISASGLATALAVGSATIWAATGSLNASAQAAVPAQAAPAPSPCDLLAKALAQLALLMSGQATVAVETPQLGRVEFNKTSVGDLQRLIQMLTDQCAAAGGPLPAGCSGLRRRPISVEVWP